jgi:hypothetical protein
MEWFAVRFVGDDQMFVVAVCQVLVAPGQTSELSGCPQ